MRIFRSTYSCFYLQHTFLDARSVIILANKKKTNINLDIEISMGNIKNFEVTRRLSIKKALITTSEIFTSIFKYIQVFCERE